MNRVALITGVSRRHGIGYGIAHALASKGFDLFLHGYTAFDVDQPWGADEGGVNLQSQSLQELGVRIETIEADLGQTSSPGQVVGAGVKAFDHIDVMVINHAYSTYQNLQQLTASEIDKHLLVNVRATLLLVKSFATQFKKNNGRVIMMTSGQHLGPMPEELAYVASKGAIHQLTASLSDTLIEQGITINTINPGPTDTNSYANPESSKEMKAIHEAVIANMPLGRWGTPEDVGRLAAWLASEDSGWVTGQVINSEGGFRR